MSSTVDSEAVRLAREVFEPDKVRVKVRVSWRGGICLPDKVGEAEEEAVFAAFTFGDHCVIERAVSRDVDIEGGRARVTEVDLNEYKRLMLRRTLLSWTLDIPIERNESGWMTEGCYGRVARVNAPLMVAFMAGLEDTLGLSDDEERRIERQSALLFSKASRGVQDACEAVGLFCTLGNFWEKFGLDKFSLPRLPYREYLMLRMMVGKESEATKVNSRPRPASTTRIAGAGGRTRLSRGVVSPG